MEDKYNGKIFREYRIGRYIADGVINKQIYIDGQVFSKIAFELNGCLFDGHNCKQSNFNQEKINNVQKKRQFYLRHNFYPVFVWECQYLAVAPNQFYERITYHKQMKLKKLYADPRKALFGGRTNNLKFEYKVRDGQTLRYVDFTSVLSIGFGPQFLSDRSSSRYSERLPSNWRCLRFRFV